MKKKVFYLVIAAVVAIACWNVNLNSKNDAHLSDLFVRNVEALASETGLDECLYHCVYSLSSTCVIIYSDGVGVCRSGRDQSRIKLKRAIFKIRFWDSLNLLM
jgi:hypothetical protein